MFIPSIEIAAHAKQGFPHYLQFSKALIGPRHACGFPNSVRLRLHNKITQVRTEIIKNGENKDGRNVGQEEPPTVTCTTV
jgi:hypothetical protein